MIPHDDDERLPFTLPFVFLIVSIAIVGQFVSIVALAGLTAKTSLSLFGMGTILGYGLAIVIAAPRIAPPPERWLGITRPPSAAWLAALLLIPAVLIASELDNLIRGVFSVPPISDEETRLEGFEVVEAAVLLIVVTPLVFELFYRGVLFTPLVKLFGGNTAVLVLGLISGFGLNGLAFTSPEQGAGGALASLVQGASIAWILSLLRYCSGSLGPGLLLSVGIGVITWLASLRAFGISGFDDLSGAHTSVVWLAPAGASVGLGLGICRSLLAQAGSAEGESRREQSESEEDRE